MKKWNISKTQYKVSDFLTWMKTETLLLSPSFQRRSVWKKGAKSYLIDTIIRDLPIPIIFIRERRTNLTTLEPLREIIDGQQRLRTLIGYIQPNLLKDFSELKDDFTIQKVHNTKYAGCKFHDLPISVQQTILDYQFSVHVLPSDVEDRHILQIFSRMNSTGVKLNEQEIRNAEFFGELKSSVYDAAFRNLERWRSWGIFSEENIARMFEVELTSEIYMLMLKGITDKNQRSINFLYDEYDENFSQKLIIEQRFDFIMDEIEQHIDKKIINTIYCKKTTFYILFYILHKKYFGEKVIYKKLSPNKVSKEFYNSLLKIGQDLKTMGLETIIEGGTRRLSTEKGRLELIKNISSKV